MHELSIALAVIDIAAEEAARRRADLKAIHIKLGALSGVVRRALVSAYELAREGTAAETSDLVIEETPIVVRCGGCQVESTIASSQSLVCSRCGQPTFDVVSGRELEVTALELES